MKTIKVTLISKMAASIVSLTMILSGCAGNTGNPAAGFEQVSDKPSKDESKNPLADTEWRLVEFQSMDDSIGTTRSEEPSLYTMRLNRDGTVQMKLNCNVAKGTWSAEPGSDGLSGLFEFGPLASTRSLCPPPSLDTQITRQSEYIRSYLLKDGRLYLSLMADGGIFVWEPNLEEPFQTQADPDIEKAILSVEPYYNKDVIDVNSGLGKARYVYGRVDLNGDGREEVLVYLLGSIFCGTGGCNLLLFSDASTGYALINEFSISRLPVIVSNQTNNGWKDIVRLESGGGAPASYVRHRFDGKAYVEQERFSTEQPPDGKRYLAGDLSFDKGIPLEPRN